MRYVPYPISNERYDTCGNFIVFLRAQIDDDFKVSGVAFSDNAPPFYIQEVERMKSKLNLRALENTAREKGLRKYTILFPIFYISTFTCDANMNSNCKSIGLTQFDKENIKGLCLFTDPIKIMLQSTGQ